MKTSCIALLVGSIVDLVDIDTSVIEERDVERPASPAALIGAVSPPEDE